MLIGHSRPAGQTNALVGAGAAFDTDPSRLQNGRPASRTALKWLSGGQTIASALKLQVTWPVAQPVRIIPFLNVTLPAGLPLTFTGRRATDPAGTFPYALGGNSTTQTVFAFPDGSFGAYCVTDPGLANLVGYQITMTNNIGGATVMTPGEFFYLGETDALQGWQAPNGIKREWKPDFENLPTDVRSDFNQPWPSPEPTNGLLDIELGNVDYKTAFGDPGNPTAIDYDRLAHILTGGDVCCAITRWRNADGTLDPWSIHRTALFGVARKVGRPDHVGGNRYSMSLTFAEAPAMV